MSYITPEMQAIIDQATAVGQDMAVAVAGGGGGRLLPAGYAYGRLVEVVELGNQPQEFQGKAKDPAREVQLGFALWGEGYQNDDGTPYIVRLYPFPLLQNDKSRSFKLFKLLNWTGTKHNFAGMLGEAFLVKIVHEPKSKTDPKIVSRIDLTGFLPPHDAITKAPYPIPAPPPGCIRLFMWDFPTKAAWDSLYVDGKWDDGGSKNRLQETMLAALDFQGSALQSILLESGVQDLPTAPATPAAAVLPATPNVGVAALPTTPVAALVPAVTPAATPSPAVVAAPLAQSPVVQPVVAPVAPAAAVLPGFSTAPVVSTDSPTSPTTSPSDQPA